MSERPIKLNLQLGVATAALQIEGGDRNNNWFDWANQPGRIADGSTPLRATDHWNRWPEDTAMLGELGVQVYRMSVEWARLEPSPGMFNEAALQHYRDEITAIKAAGVKPLVTVHHFSHPLWFQRLGEFANPYSVEVFQRFTRFVVEGLGDLVDEWVTINEPNVYATQAYLFGQAPPGKRSWKSLRLVLRHMAQAHCLAYDLIHTIQPDAKVGFAHHMRAFKPLNPRHLVHRGLVRANEWLFQEVIADAMLAGKFSPILGSPGAVRPGRYFDYLGINYYTRTTTSRFAADETAANVAINDLGWEIYPQGLVECAAWLYERYPAPIWVTENGTCDNGDQERVERFRTRFIYDHLRAIAESELPFERYYHWCFVDNWEWNEGEVPRFGVVCLDYDTQQRTLKPSGEFLADVIANSGVTAAAIERWVAPESYRVS